MNVARMSPNLALNQMVDERRANGEPLIHLAFGEARLPVLPELARQLAEGAGRAAYGPIAGAESTRAAVAGYFSRRRLPTDADQIVLAPGSKALLMALQLAVPGDVVLPRPAWNSYAAQVAYAGKQVIGVPIPAACGGVPESTALQSAVQAARASGRDPQLLVLTLPDNPTGTLASPALVREVCAVAEAEDLLIISDEIYRDLVHDPVATPFLSPAEIAPERTVVTSGLSKSLGIGGWRIGVARFPEDHHLRDAVVSVASEIWSTPAGPMQHVAEYVYAEPPEIRDRLTASARLHGKVARAVHDVVTRSGARCRPPTGGFYVYPDFEPTSERLAAHGIKNAPDLSQRLLNDSGVVVLAGHLLGDDPRGLRFKAATSLLYGDEEQQRQALAAEDPVGLPHLSAVLTRLEEALTRLTMPTTTP
jgi:aspartate aminotransferase